MRSNEFIKEAGRNGSMDDFGQPINPIPTDAEYAARQAAGQKNFDTLKGVGSKIANAFKGTGTQSATPADDTTEAGYLVDRNGNPVTDGSGQPIRTPNSRIPKAAAMPAYQARDLPDPRSFDRTEPAYADRFKPGQSATPGFVMPPPGVIFNDPDAEARAAAAAERNRKAITSTEPTPAVKPAPAPAPVQNADPVPSLRVPGAAQAGQGGTNYTTGVAQDRPHRPDAGADQTTRNDYPFVPYTGPGPKPNVKPVVKPVQNPQLVPKPQIGGKFSKGTPLPGPDGTTPVPALAYKTVGPEFKPYTQQVKTLPTGNSATPAAAATGGYPNAVTDPEGYKKEIDRRMLKKYAGSASATPAAASSVVIKPGDTLSKIAAANGTTVQAIMAANPSIRDQNTIAAGQTVKLRESSEVARIRHLAGLTKN